MQAASAHTIAELTASDVFRLLADDTRLRAICLLHGYGELCVCELTETLAVSQPKMSRHLAMLRDGGLVETRRSGQWIHYRLRGDLPAWAKTTLTNACDGLATEAPFQSDARRAARAIAKNRSECEL
jgi:ArsR family transcriptional regulator